MTHPNLLSLNHRFSAPPAFVYTLWSNPALVSAWWGPEGHHLAACEIDFCPGGSWRFNMARDGVDYWAHGTYHEIVPDQRLLFSYRFPMYGVQSVVSVTLAPEGQETRMRFLQTGFPDEENFTGHTGGWTSTFAILENLLLQLNGVGSVYPDLPPAKVSDVAKDLAEARRRYDASLLERTEN